jgi:hypothetical protein
MTARDILQDGFVMRYVSRDMWNTYYTCIPTDSKKTSYECFLGFVDTTYSDKSYKESDWLMGKVPFYVPASFHESYLNGKISDICLRILKK